MSEDRETLQAGCCFVAIMIAFLGIGWMLFTNRLDAVSQVVTTIEDYYSGRRNAPPPGYYPETVPASYRSHRTGHRHSTHPHR